MMGITGACLWIGGRIVIAVAVVATAWAFGQPLTRAIRFSSELERFVIASALGLAALGASLFVLGLGHSLDRVWISGLVIAIHLIALPEWRKAFSAMVRGVGAIWRREKPAFNRNTVLSGLLALALLPIALLPLYPAMEFDALSYHLPYARGFNLTGEMPFFDDLLYPVFPQLQELLFAAAMQFGEEVDAQMVSLFEVALVAILLHCWGCRLGKPLVGAAAAALWVGTPLVVLHAGTAYVDVGFALFGGATVYAWRCWQKGGGVPWATVAAAFASAAAAVKYIGLFFPVFLAVVFVVACRHRRHWVGALRGLLLIVMLTAPWYVRIWAVAGNPVFPYYPEIFGASAWSDAADQQVGAGLQDDGDVPSMLERHAEAAVKGIGTLILVPYNTLFQRHVYNNQAPLSPWLLILLPTAGLAALRSAEARALCLPIVAFCLAWLVTTREPRFLLAVMPPLAVVLALGCRRLLNYVRNPRTRVVLATVLVLAFFLPGPTYAAFKHFERGVIPIDSGGRERFRQRVVPGFGAIVWLNQRFGSNYTAFAWYAPWLKFHAEGRMLGDAFGPYSERAVLLRLRDDPYWGLQQLRAFGVDFVVQTDNWGATSLDLPPRLRRSLEPLVSGDGWQIWRVPTKNTCRPRARTQSPS